MKFQTDNGNQDNLNKKNQRKQNDMELLIKRLPVLNDYFQLHNKIGQGTFSNVYLATLRNSNSTQKYAVKHLIQACEQSRVQSELRCLQEIGGKDNVVPAEFCLSDGKDCVTFVMPYLPHLRFADYVGDMDVEETRLYMKNLFIALKRVHSFNIIHRDVKPDNFLYNRETKQFFLVDFGLAQLVKTPNQEVIAKSSLTNENLPIDYSKKRKRTSESSEEESKSFTKNVKRIALKSKDNNIKIWQTPKTAHETKTEGENNRVFSTLIDVSKMQRTNKLSPDKASQKPRVFNASNASSAGKKKLSENCEEESLANKTSPGPTTFKAEHRTIKTDRENSFKMLGNVCLTPLTASKPLTSVNASSPLPGRSSKMFRKQSSVPAGLPKQPTSTSSYVQACLCSGKSAVCSLCSSRDRMDAPRAGTSGFRAPEVLFRYPYQTTAVDMWASGVVMLCILSGCYPFFYSSTDLVSLAEIMTIFGTERTIKVAAKFGRRILCSEHRKGVDLKKLCARLRARSVNKSKSKKNYSNEPKCRDCQQTIRSDGCLCPSDGTTIGGTIEPIEDPAILQFPDSAFDLLYRLLDLDPTSRITAEEALEHPFIVGL